MSRVSRRRFLARSAAASAAFAGAGLSASPWLRAAGANDDVRKLLDNKDIDAVVVTTPNHWHALVTVWACQAGKDVYVQKPASHNIFEGRKMVEAAAKYGRIVQCPNGSRSPNGHAEALEYVRQGKLGNVLKIRHVHFSPRCSIGKVSGPRPIPSTVDYNLWSGPAPMEPLVRENLHYDWHWQWPYGDGELGNWGIHHLDGCRMFVGGGLPRRRSRERHAPGAPFGLAGPPGQHFVPGGTLDARRRDLPADPGQRGVVRGVRAFPRPRTIP